MPARRIIEVNQSIIGPPAPRERSVRPRKRSDFPAVSAVYLDAAERLSSPLVMGPPLCDEYIAFIRHLFTEEEAGVVRHLGGMRGKTAAAVARAEHRPVEDVRRILDGLAFTKRAIVAKGEGEKRQYQLMPLIPGVFEMVLIGERPETMSEWHRRFAELFEALYDTGYSTEYSQKRVPFVRYLPVGRALEAGAMALPTDRLEVILDRFDTFAVGQCQCRMSAAVVGKGCGKPVSNCAVMGEFAEKGIAQGWVKEVSRKGLLEIKLEAEANGLVNWMLNVDSTKTQNSCSCCGCCCKAMRAVNEFNAPGMMAPPHFIPGMDASKCVYCGKCALKCPMGALTVDTKAKTWSRRAERCIGCGLCAVACDKAKAIRMEPVPDYEMPYRSWFSLIASTTPGRLARAWKVWRNRP